MRRSLWNIPNILTLLRVACIPVLVLVVYSGWPHRFGFSAAIFALAALTDWLDGYLARALQQTSAFGRFLDPVADKLMVAAALIVLVDGQHSVLLAIPAIVIVAREITISALREWMAEIGKRASVAVSYIGKLKTAAQMMAITLLLAQSPVHDAAGRLQLDAWGWFSYLLLYAAVILTLWSMLLYLRAAWPDLRLSDAAENSRHS